MKKIIIILGLVCTILVGCNEVSNIEIDNGNLETNKQIAEESQILNDSSVIDGVGGQSATAVDGIHHEMYYAVELAFIDHFIGRDEFYDNYFPIFGNTMDNNYRGICEYYGITKSEYIEFWEDMKIVYNESHLADIWSFEEMYPLEVMYDEWFADDYETNSLFFSNDYKASLSGQISTGMAFTKSSSEPYISTNRSTNNTIRYYTIDGKLIETVGANAFKKYLSETKDVNILSFIEYFDLTKEEYLKIYDGYALYPYNPEYLFSSEKSSVYFNVNTSGRAK